jgi:hypothetical protein
MKLGHVFAFIFSFSLQVRVHAEVAHFSVAQTTPVAQLELAERVVQEPSGCLEKFRDEKNHDVAMNRADGCAIRTGAGQRFNLKLKSTTLLLDQNTIVDFSLDRATLIQGAVWVQTQSVYSVGCEFGRAEINKGEFWVARTSDGMKVAALDSVVQLFPKGATETLLIDPGFENEVGKVQMTGVAKTGVPQAIEYQEHIARMARIYPGTKPEFTHAIEKFHHLWLSASRRAAEIHEQLYQRKIASIEEQKARESEARRKRKAELDYYRALARKRVFGEEP